MARRMPASWIVALILLFIGAIFGAVGFGFWFKSYRLRSGAAQAEGEVIRLEGGRGRYPVVRFRVDGRDMEFRGSIASSPPAFEVGERVTVLFPPDRPQDAEIDSFSQQHLFPVIFGGVGGLLSLAAFGVFLIPGILLRTRQRILDQGIAVEGEVRCVELNTSVSVNGRHPWVIVAEFRDDLSGMTYPARSHYIWTFPEPHYPPGSRVTIYYLQEKPHKYAFHLDRLPEEA